MRKFMMIFLVINFILITTVFMFAANQENNAQSATAAPAVTASSSSPVVDYTKVAKYIAAAVAVAGATFSSGIAVGRIGAAAMGAVSEKPEAAGTAMILAALAEGVCLWGIAGAFLILFF